ncbi:MAG: maleylpyruvate isomerase N-terminal domain-containing protein, partial [Propionibacteriaceae bacterium]|nr:maleylpyruvate isomerase N-terminal domain-containing protein [Propionibacteriaceae bacterium]
MDTREWFAAAAGGLGTVVENLAPTHLGAPGLGEWDVRALLGHACRAFLTIENYLAAARDTPPELVLEGPADYFRAALAGMGDPAQVAQRGRDAGAALGEDPIGAARQIAERVSATVARSPDQAPVATPVGGMTLAGHLPTRAFELTVHGIDLAR